jgi:hypothetical protein
LSDSYYDETDVCNVAYLSQFTPGVALTVAQCMDDVSRWRR